MNTFLFYLKSFIVSRFYLCLFLVFLSALISAQRIHQKDLDELSLNYAKSSFEELKEFFSLPNDAYFPEQIEKNVVWSENAFQKRGFSLERLATSHAPLLLAQRTFPRASKTVLIYLQIDGQPVDKSKWFQKDPYIPVLKQQNAEKWDSISWDNLKGKIDPDWRIFSRSASDARGPVMMFLKAIDILNDRKQAPNFNIKVIMDFEEELGSPRLPNAVNTYNEKLASDMLVIFDGPRHISNQPTLSFGARGIATISLEVFGPREPAHSGNYGNYVPNPAFKLSHLLSSMVDENGKVLIPTWYDGIELSNEVKEILKRVPDKDAELMKKFGIAETEKIAPTFQESMQYPALGVLGLQAAWVGKQRRTIIPASAIAELNIRLVKETNGERMVNLVKQFIVDKGYYLVDDKPTEEERMKYPNIARFNSEISYGAFRTDFNTDLGEWLVRAMQKAFNKDPIQIRTMGGSIPISPFVVSLKIPAVSVPTVNADNNQHSPNENIRLGNYIDGIKTITAILTEKI